MSAFGGLFITNVGRALQLKAQTGVQLNFTRMAVGNGELGSSIIADLRDMKNEIKSLSIDRLQVLTDNKAIVSSTLSNQNLQSGFYFREVGVFAEDPDEGEVLYCYGNAGDNAEYIPGGGGADVIEKIIEILTIIGNAENVTATIDESLAYVTVNRYENEQGTITLETVADQVRPAINELNETVVSMSSFTKDGFQNFVVGGEPQGGVKRIWYDDPAIEYKNMYEATVIPSNGPTFTAMRRYNDVMEIKYTFTGSGIGLVTEFENSMGIWKVEIDGVQYPDIDCYIPQELDTGPQLAVVTEDLEYGKHTIILTYGGVNSEADNNILSFFGFDIIQTTNQSSKNFTGTSYIDAVKADITADTQSYTTPSQGRCDLLVVNKQGATSVVEGTDGTSEKAFRVEEDGTISREYVENIPEWLKDGIKVWNSGVTGDNVTGWRNNNDKQSSGNYNLKTKLTNATFYIGFVGTGIDLCNVTWDNGGEFAVSIDGSSETIFDAYSFDTVWQNRVNIASRLDFGYHEAKIRITGTKNASSSGFYIYIDAFDIYLPATPDLPADTQPLAKVYPMPDAEPMSSIPARPTSQEEKGWIRYESDEGCRYVGSGWSGYTLSPGESNHNSMISSTVGDYFEFIFIGDAVRLLGRLPDDSYNVEISVDGTVVDNLTTVVTETESVLYENTNLTNGYHTLRGEILSAGGYVHIDAFEVHRPLYLTDIRNTTPIHEKDTYNIEHNSRLTEPNASGKLGEVIDRLFRMDNVIHISNENGTAYLYPDGRAECYIYDVQSHMPSGEVVFKVNYHPIVFSRVDNRQISVQDDTPQYFDVGMRDANNSETEIRIENLHTGTIGVSWYLEVKGRWY